MERPDDRIPVRPSRAAVIWIALVAALLTGTSGIGRGPRPSETPRGAKVKVPTGARPDLGRPPFSSPESVTNPLLPVSRLAQVIQLGAEGGDRLRFEMTLLPGTRTIEWGGRSVATVMSQLVAYSNGRVAEVATDFYAQDDDGAVWHFGEDAANYDDGVLVDREGTWLAGRDGQPAMVMPARPQPGDVYRWQSAPGQGTEEVTVRATDQTVDGPRGPVGGGLVIQEQLADGTSEDKVFAPGYGELSARSPAQDELYSVAVAAPTDAAGGGVPEALAAVTSGAQDILAGSPPAPDWNQVVAAVGAMTEAWTRYAPGGETGLLLSEMSDRLADLVAAAAGRRPARLQRAAIEVAHAGLDLQLRHRPRADVDRDRLRLWARHVLVDAAAGDGGAVAGDVVVLDALRARLAPAPGPAQAGLDTALVDLRVAASSGDMGAAAAAATSLFAP